MAGQCLEGPAEGSPTGTQSKVDARRTLLTLLCREFQKRRALHVKNATGMCTHSKSAIAPTLARSLMEVYRLDMQSTRTIVLLSGLPTPDASLIASRACSKQAFLGSGTATRPAPCLQSTIKRRHISLVSMQRQSNVPVDLCTTTHTIDSEDGCAQHCKQSCQSPVAHSAMARGGSPLSIN